MITIIGLETRCPQSDRWEAYKWQLVKTGDLSEANNKVPSPAEVHTLMERFYWKMSVSGWGQSQAVNS